MENKSAPYPGYAPPPSESYGYTPYPSQPTYPQTGYPPQPNPSANYPPPYPGQQSFVQPGIQPPVVVPATNLATSVIVVGGNCPNCHMGVLQEDFDCCGICCAIFFFPIGILCCLAMRKKRCSHCLTVFG